MMGKLIETRLFHYKLHSENAASLEQGGNYAKAQTEWEKAARYSVSTTQQNWCASRADFCERMVKRPFRGN